MEDILIIEEGSRDEEGRTLPRKYSINGDVLKEKGVYDSVALEQARGLCSALNTMLGAPLKNPRSFRKYKKDPRDKIVAAMLHLLSVATSPRENKDVPGDHKVIKDVYKPHINEMIIARKKRPEIQEMLRSKFKAKVGRSTLDSYIHSYKKTNEYIKDAKLWMEQVDDVRLYHKRGRLSELEELYIEAYRQWKSNKTKSNTDMCLKILEAARKEAMPIMNNIQINNNNIQASIFTNILAREEELRVLERLPLHEIIIGRVAAKFGRDPYILQGRLQNSYYAAQAGNKGMDKLKDDVQYPTAILYDVESLRDNWNEIQKKEELSLAASKEKVKASEKDSEAKDKILNKIKALKAKSGGSEKK